MHGKIWQALIFLLGLLGLSFIIALSTGAVNISFLQAVKFLALPDQSGFLYEVFSNIRLPRVLATCLAGFLLGISGAMVQGVFKNPLADPGLIGVSAGAALFVIMFLSLLQFFPALVVLNEWLGFFSLAFFAFIGALLSTLLVYKLSMVSGKTSIFTMLLAGIAINAFAGALSGFLIYMSNDETLRSFSFWTLGSMAGADFKQAMILAILVFLVSITITFLAKALNAFLLGEAEAHYLGIKVEQVKRIIIVVVASSIAAVTAFYGIIAFVALVVPHLIRLGIGPDHRYLLLFSGLLGASLLLLADLVARTVTSPAEMPLGVITSLIGAPFFLWLLLVQKRRGANF